MSHLEVTHLYKYMYMYIPVHIYRVSVSNHVPGFTGQSCIPTGGLYEVYVC